MDKDTLYRFFEGTATFGEEKRIRNWLQQSEINYDIFLRERKEYDALLLTPYKSFSKEKRKRLLSPWIASAAASVILLLIVGGLYLYTNQEREEEYNTIVVPPGQRINLILSDNTSLWLNANTTFRYPTEFFKRNRTVYLDGEAYFDVSKNEKKPFVVKTGAGDIRVTGTSFNVEAYSRFDTFETSLFEGGVDIYKDEVKLASLRPNEKSLFENNKISISKITDTDKYLWRNGLIAFNDQKLENILTSLEKYFDIKIEINARSLPQHTYTGKFRQSDGVDYALRVLQKSIHFKYERNEETGVIYIR
jgi:Fe2+-dicitrate sensor, membrane component